MCLAIPAQVETVDQDGAVVQIGGNRLQVSTVLVGPVEPGQWLLIHAGYAITKLDPQAAAETWELLSALPQADAPELQA